MKYNISRVCSLSVRRNLKSADGSDGFTLVELIVVCAILGVLTLMTYPVYDRYVYTTKVARCVADIRTLDKDVNAYYIDKNVYPAQATWLTDIGRDGIRDAWNRPYEYRVIPSLELTSTFKMNDTFDLFSLGKNGLSADFPDANTDDDIVRANDGSYVGLREGM